MDVEYGPDGEPLDANKDYSEYERGELSWAHDAVTRLADLVAKRPMADLMTLINTTQHLAVSDEDADEIEAYHVEDAYAGLWT